MQKTSVDIKAARESLMNTVAVMGAAAASMKQIPPGGDKILETAEIINDVFNWMEGKPNTTLEHILKVSAEVNQKFVTRTGMDPKMALVLGAASLI